VATQCAAVKLQCAVMSHTIKDLERAAKAADLKAVASIQESQQLHRHAEHTQVFLLILLLLEFAPCCSNLNAERVG
jgi:hypothetical protein